MKKQKRDGTLPTLYKEQSSRWKGGVSSVQIVSRNDKRLYEQWKYPILTRDQFKCVECGHNKDLHVHHNDERYSDIIKKVMTLDDYDNSVCYDEDTFDLYIDIARNCHKAIPLEIMGRKEFEKFKINKTKIPKGQYIFKY